MKLIGYNYGNQDHCLDCSESQLGKDDLGYAFSLHVPSLEKGESGIINPLYDTKIYKTTTCHDCSKVLESK
tara:strand:+ start:263 stop:475 length:213 start_codon:yes stop_codon:yes gene_type:complete